MALPAATIGDVYVVKFNIFSLNSGTNEPAIRETAGLKGRIVKITAGVGSTAGTGIQFMVTNAGTDVTAASLAIVGATTLANSETFVSGTDDVAEDAALNLNVNSIGGISRDVHCEVYLVRE